ncbi:replication initiator protein A [[Clostridium] hylemonae]|uniref:replication initiator protein A n=1 Tax=[Clostridium] hylemonae TaxID=89153 RepID=UPI001D096465|nr:replication initiator protein A [[Clostridium] hylemonae]MCB7521567.1 replication initiator protein A [[Clostridium] hylemonae]
MSNDAKLLYGLLLDWANLSKGNGYLDKDGTVRLYFTVEEAKEKLRRSRQVATGAFQELESSPSRSTLPMWAKSAFRSKLGARP